MKFQFLKLDLECQTTYTCHAAQPYKIDFDWLEKNPGQLFNHDINIQERQMMLQNQRASSCEQNCWYAEDQGQTSPRIYQKGYLRTHDQIMTEPEILDLTISSDCHLTCSYCCKEFSSAWRRDIATNGEYENLGQRYQLTDQDRILMKIGQPSLMSSKRYQTLLDEIARVSRHLKVLTITGGEPFLNNQLLDILERTDLAPQAVINIYTGLGVDTARMQRMIDRLADNHRVNILISAECLDQHYEFNRFGASFDRFGKNLQIIMDSGIPFCFQSTLTNLTAFGFTEFYQRYQSHKIDIAFAYQPRMQSIHVMDDPSKQHLIERFKQLPNAVSESLITSIAREPTDQERLDLASFLKNFVSRRPGLDLKIYPPTFLSWMEC